MPAEAMKSTPKEMAKKGETDTSMSALFTMSELQKPMQPPTSMALFQLWNF
jgi:hypothetical protein